MVSINEKEAKRGSKKINFKGFFLAAALVCIAAMCWASYSMNLKATFLRSEPVSKRLKFWGVDLVIQWNPRGSMTTVKKYFEELNFEFVNASGGDDWDIAWTHLCPFSIKETNEEERLLFVGLNKPLKRHQKLNHFPGTGFLVAKSNMAKKNRGSKYILPSFQIPDELDELNRFIKNNPNKKILEKNMVNRGVKIIDANRIKTEPDYYVYYQQFMDKPYIIDGHAFDFGVYVLITSYDPLRIYRFRDVYFRFCDEEYYPFDEHNRGKYVVEGPGKPAYEMPSFVDIYGKYKFSFTKIFEHLIASKGFNVDEFWRRIDDAVVSIVMNSAEYVLYKTEVLNLSAHNYFEMVRFDIILDEQLNPYVVEVNMSPNLTPAEARFDENGKLFEQLAFNCIKMIGGSSYYEFTSRLSESDTAMCNAKDVAVNIKQCIENNCVDSCFNPACQTCLPCFNEENRYHIREAFRESLHLGNFVRLFPASLYYNDTKLIGSMTKKNQFSINWFKGKCEMDKRWC